MTDNPYSNILQDMTVLPVNRPWMVSGAAARIYNWGGKIYCTLPEAVHRGA